MDRLLDFVYLVLFFGVGMYAYWIIGGILCAFINWLKEVR